MSRLACLRFAGAAALTLASAGCSADVQDLFGGGSEGSGGSSSSSQTTAESTSGPGSTTTGPGSTTTGDTTVTTGDTTSGGPSTTTSGNPATTVSTGTGTPGPTVDCDGTTCSIDNDGVCCWTDSSETAACLPASSCQGSIGSVATAISCQTQDQCPGQVCCAHRAFMSSQSPYESAVCSDQCDYPDLYLCEGPNDSSCPAYQDGNGGTIQSFCKASQLLPPGYYICGFN
jgi:hypothetical protein